MGATLTILDHLTELSLAQKMATASRFGEKQVQRRRTSLGNAGLWRSPKTSLLSLTAIGYTGAQPIRGPSIRSTRRRKPITHTIAPALRATKPGPGRTAEGADQAPDGLEKDEIVAPSSAVGKDGQTKTFSSQS